MQQIVMPQPSLDIFKTATDSLMLPVRRPILFVPFLFTMALAAVLLTMVVMGTGSFLLVAGTVDLRHMIALFGSVALIIFTTVLAIEATTVLTAQAEVGKNLDLAEAVAHSLSRFPVTLATTAVMTLGIMVGLILLVIPGLVLIVRWSLAPNAALLTRRGAFEAIALSWQLTGANFVPLFALVVLIGVATSILSIPLGLIPVVGWLAAAWLGFAWGAIALAMAHVRLGAPIDVG